MKTGVNKPPIDFIDLGASKGGCIDFACKHLGGRRGLGIDLNADKVAFMRQNGYECIQADATRLPFRDKSVRFVTMSHILEHLPSLDAVEAAIRSAAHAASDFLFIQGPYFDADAELEAQGFRFYWSWWSGHKCHLTSWQLIDILDRVSCSDRAVFVRHPVHDSSDPTIHPLTSPHNQHAYDRAVHPAKPHVTFTRPAFREIVCYVQLRPLPNWSEIIAARGACIPLSAVERMDPRQPAWRKLRRTFSRLFAPKCPPNGEAG